MAVTLQYLESISSHNSGRRQGRASWVPSLYGCLSTGPFLCRLIDCSWLQLRWLPDMNGYDMPRRQYCTSLLSTPLLQGSWSFRRDKINVMLRVEHSVFMYPWFLEQACVSALLLCVRSCGILEWAGKVWLHSKWVCIVWHRHSHVRDQCLRTIGKLAKPSWGPHKCV